MTEFLNGIKVIKFYSWEKYFLKRIESVRKKELTQLKAKKYLDAGCVYFWACTPILMSVLTFMTYVFIGNKLTPAKVNQVFIIQIELINLYLIHNYSDLSEFVSAPYACRILT